MKSNVFKSLLLVSAFAVSSIASSHAALLFSDSFNYDVGSLTGTNGWTNIDADPRTVTSPGLSYQSLAVSGNKTSDGGTQAQGGSKDMGIGLLANGTYWFSFLVDHTNSSGDLKVAFFSNGTIYTDNGLDRSFGLKQDTSSGNPQVTITAAGAVTPSAATFTDLGTNLFVGKADISNLSTTFDAAISIWVNPTIGPSWTGNEVDLGTALVTYSGTGLGLGGSPTPADFTKIQVRSNGAYTGDVDEIRLGTTLADVTPVPEPSTMALLAGSLVGLAFLRRRRGH